jgi:Flp pilus assembly pilin Flp
VYEKFRTSFLALRRDGRGVTAVEYAIIAAVMAGAVGLAFTNLGSGLSSAVSTVF